MRGCASAEAAAVDGKLELVVVAVVVVAERRFAV